MLKYHRVEYTLTELGQSLRPILDAMRNGARIIKLLSTESSGEEYDHWRYNYQSLMDIDFDYLKNKEKNIK